MHEYSLVTRLLERVEEEARARGATAVRTVRVQVGELSGVEPELLSTAFEMARAGTLAAVAELRVDVVPIRWECRACARPIAEGAPLRCPACGEPARLATGGEIVLSQIELEVP